MRIRGLMGAILAAAVLAGAAGTEGARGDEAGAGREAVYTAKANLEFHLRPEPASEKWVGVIPIHQRVEVLEYGEDWSLLRYEGTEGYAETRWLREFITLDPLEHSLPGYVPCTGMWTFREETLVAAGDFSGLAVKAGASAAVRTDGDDIILPVWRDEMRLDEGSGSYTAFVPWEEAKAGDLIAGFTTFYNDSYGAPLARERRENIELGCRLMNGLVLEPEHSFSFNGTCGPYNGQTGYKVARNISSSGYGTGGGVCQLSTTLYNAALEIPIQVTDWAVHSISGVKYIPVAYDACVGRYSDFCFRNTLAYALRLEAETQGGALTVRIYRQE